MNLFLPLDSPLRAITPDNMELTPASTELTPDNIEPVSSVMVTLVPICYGNSD